MRVLDLDSVFDETLRQQRQDLEVHSEDGTLAAGQVAPSFFDAVLAYDREADPDFLALALDALRPGGRLILLQSSAALDAAYVEILEQAGYTRILVEQQADDALLLRGEKPHVEQRTLDRIQVVAAQDADLRKPYVHLLIRQTPNKPIWALREDEDLEWAALALGTDADLQLLVFSSLPKAVAFMQPAVLQGRHLEVNKVARFKREIALSWPLPMLLDPPVEILAGESLSLWPVDPQSAEQPDE